MGAQDKTVDAYNAFAFPGGPFVTTANTETIRVPAPNANIRGLLQNQYISAQYPQNEVWIPVGVWWNISTTTTVTAPVLTLRKNGVTATVGGSFTVPIQAAAAVTLVYSPLPDWTTGFASAPQPGDAWSLLVTTTSTAGALGNLIMVYAIRDYAGVVSGVPL